MCGTGIKRRLSVMKNEGMAWHVHHSNLVEYCDDYKERFEVIKFTKPPDEIPLRLRLFKFVEGELPEEVIEVCQEYTKARREYNEAHWEYQEASSEYWHARKHYKGSDAWQKREDAFQKRGEAEIKSGEAYRKYLGTIKSNLKVIEELHAIECTDCTWDGQKIKF